MESTTGNPLPYLDILCHMLVKTVFDVFANRVAKPEIMRLSPVGNYRLTGFQPNAMEFPKSLRGLRKKLPKYVPWCYPCGQPAQRLGVISIGRL